MKRPPLKKLSLYLTPLAAVVVMALVWLQILKPMAISFITAQLPKINSSQNVVNLEVEKIDLSLLKLQLLAYGITADFSKSDPSLAPVKAAAVSCQLDIFNLIIGQINLSKLIIDTAEWNFEIKPDPGPKKKFSVPVADIFHYAELIPVDRIVLYNSVLHLKSNSPRLETEIQISQASLLNRKNELSLAADKVSFSAVSGDRESVTLESSLNAEMTPKLLSLRGLHLQTLDSNFELKGEFRLHDVLDENLEGHTALKSKINLQDVRTLALILFPQKDRFPSVSGFVESTGELGFNTADGTAQGELSLSTTQVVVDHFKLGQASLKASVKNQKIELNELNLEHPAGNIALKNLQISQRAPYTFSTKLEASGVDLQKMFVSLGLTEIPAGFMARASATCQGTLNPPVAGCDVVTDLTDIWVKSGLKTSSHILKIKRAGLKGETRLTRDGLSYRTDIKVGESLGSSSGNVDFSKGFDIEYKTDRLDFADVESLADLKLKGLLKISGTTRGNSSYGVIQAKASVTGAELEDFRLGNVDTDLNYKDTELTFSNLTATVGPSVFGGHLHFDFKQSRLDGNFSSPNLRAADVMSVLNQKFPLPFSVTGAGKADVRVEGPFNFWKMSYTLKSEFSNGDVAGESYAKLNLDVESDGKRIAFQNVSLKKQKTVLTAGGEINTSGREPEFNLKVSANPFLLEEIDHVIRYTPSISGVGYADGRVTGPLASPIFAANFTLKQVSYDKVDYPNSQGQVELDKKFLKFNGQFFGRQIQSDVVWPWSAHDGFSAKVQIHDLNPLFLLPLISVPQPNSDFSSRLNAEVDLSSKNRDIGAAQGYIRVNDFIVQRGTQFLKLEKPASLVFKSGLSQMDDISLKGDDGYLNVKLNRASSDSIRLNVLADLQLRLFHFLVPFTQSLSGNLVVDSQVQFRNGSFELFGEGELVDGYVSLKGFPQAIENINTPIEFSKSKIFLTDITAQLGQSDVTGVGQIDILSSKNIVVNLRAVADNVELNFPDKILTFGKANLLFSGNSLPYTLKVDYKISHGLVEKNFGEDENQTMSLRASSYLPPQQIEQLTPALLLDVNVDFTNGLIVKNKLVEGEAVGQLQITGTPDTPILKGQIDIRQGSHVIFKDKPFDVQTANIQFHGTKDINPSVYISANSRVSDYDINVLIQGTAKNYEIVPTSQPPLSKSDIFSLLALGVTSQGDQNMTSDTQQKQTTIEVLSSITNQSQLNQRIQEKLGLTVQLAPSVDSTKNIAVPKVVVTKKISNRVNASYAKPFTGNDQNQEVKLQYLYNNNMSLQFNYQNKDTGQQEQLSNPNLNSKSIFGVDLEFRDDFK